MRIEEGTLPVVLPRFGRGDYSDVLVRLPSPSYLSFCPTSSSLSSPHRLLSFLTFQLIQPQ